MAENKYTMDELRQRQALPLEAKVELTKLRIRWWLDKFPSYISFSGGKDSTVLLHIARQVRRDIPAVFVDTGLEYPEIRNFALAQDNVIRLKPDMNFRKVIETYGYPLISKDVAKQIRTARNGTPNAVLAFDGKNVAGEETWFRQRYKKWKFLYESDIPISEQCCDIMKKKPAKLYEKETGRKPIVGTMACESQNRRNAWLQNGCNAYDSPRPISRPMSIWTEQDVLQYIYDNKIPYATVYGDIIHDKDGKFSTTGCSRTGCVFCAFGCHLEKEPNRFQTLKLTHPKLWEYCMKDFNGGLRNEECLGIYRSKNRMNDGFNKPVNMTFLHDVLCFESYSEDGNEYWSEGNVYEASRDGNYWYIKTNFGGVGVIGDGYAIEDLDDYFIYLS